MIRTQIYFTEEQYNLLKQTAVKSKVTMAEIIRTAVEGYLNKRTAEEEPLLKIIGIGESGDPNASLHIDEVLYGGKSLR